MIARLLCLLGLHDWKCVYVRPWQDAIYHEGWCCMRCPKFKAMAWNA